MTEYCDPISVGTFQYRPVGLAFHHLSDIRCQVLQHLSGMLRPIHTADDKEVKLSIAIIATGLLILVVMVCLTQKSHPGHRHHLSRTGHSTDARSDDHFSAPKERTGEEGHRP